LTVQNLHHCSVLHLTVAGAMASPSRQRILIVEDDPLIAFALETMLSEQGFDVASCVAQIPAALEAIGREPIDGAILDVSLGSQRIDPVADALAACACPFFFMTGHGVMEIPARHSGRGVLQKPFRLEELTTALLKEFGAPSGDQYGFETDDRRSRDDHDAPACPLKLSG
jgi:DNA-binding NtrC family response regulator